MKSGNSVEFCVKALVLCLSSIGGVFCTQVNVWSDGPGVLDIPMTMNARLSGQMPIEVNQFVYVF
ncbi:unnamed protein product, partial [Medioppia subpectinata]